MSGSNNYELRADQMTVRQDAHIVGHCPHDWIFAVQLERADSSRARAGGHPALGFATKRNESFSVISIMPLLPAPWGALVEQAKVFVRCIAYARSRRVPGDPALESLTSDPRYDYVDTELVRWTIPYGLDVPTLDVPTE
jgi:hypothetical protein